jgi:hypothetical protein
LKTRHANREIPGVWVKRARSCVDAGFEPDADFAATGILPCGCMICQECRAALALHSSCPEWLEVAFDDADLQRIVTTRDGLPRAIKTAITALVGSQIG